MKRSLRDIAARYRFPIALGGAALIVALAWYAIREESIFSFHALCPLSPVCAFFTMPGHGVVWPWGAFFFGALVLSALFARRLFCGWLCPVGIVQEILHLPKRAARLPERPATPLRRRTALATRLIILAATLMVPFMTGTMFFASFCPMIRIGDVLYRTDFVGGLATLLIFVLLSLALERFFCRFICPLGLILGWAGRLGARLFPTLTVRRTCRAGDKCSRCGDACPTKIDLCAVSDTIDDPECILCLRCVKTCRCYTVGMKR